MTDGNEILLCCFLWARPGEAAGLSAYEDRVLAIVPRHGGEIIQRAVSDGSQNQPHEVQLLRFPSQAAVDAYLADPDRLALADDRDRTIERTDVFPVSFR